MVTESPHQASSTVSAADCLSPSAVVSLALLMVSGFSCTPGTLAGVPDLPCFCLNLPFQQRPFC